MAFVGRSVPGPEDAPAQRQRRETEVIPVPTGKVKWFDADKGFGFLSTDDGQEVFLHSSALPRGVTTVKPGTRMDFGIADGSAVPRRCRRPS